jgi:hypothetical protein
MPAAGVFFARRERHLFADSLDISAVPALSRLTILIYRMKNCCHLQGYQAKVRRRSDRESVGRSGRAVDVSWYSYRCRSMNLITGLIMIGSLPAEKEY